eukprot:gene1417-1641_t
MNKVVMETIDKDLYDEDTLKRLAMACHGNPNMVKYLMRGIKRYIDAEYPVYPQLMGKPTTRLAPFSSTVHPVEIANALEIVFHHLYQVSFSSPYKFGKMIQHLPSRLRLTMMMRLYTQWPEADRLTLLTQLCVSMTNHKAVGMNFVGILLAYISSHILDIKAGQIVRECAPKGHSVIAGAIRFSLLTNSYQRALFWYSLGIKLGFVGQEMAADFALYHTYKGDKSAAANHWLSYYLSVGGTESQINDQLPVIKTNVEYIDSISVFIRSHGTESRAGRPQTTNNQISLIKSHLAMADTPRLIDALEPLLRVGIIPGETLLYDCMELITKEGHNKDAYFDLLERINPPSHIRTILFHPSYYVDALLDDMNRALKHLVSHEQVLYNNCVPIITSIIKKLLRTRVPKLAKIAYSMIDEAFIRGLQFNTKTYLKLEELFHLFEEQGDRVPTYIYNQVSLRLHLSHSLALLNERWSELQGNNSTRITERDQSIYLGAPKKGHHYVDVGITLYILNQIQNAESNQIQIDKLLSPALFQYAALGQLSLTREQYLNSLFITLHRLGLSPLIHQYFTTSDAQEYFNHKKMPATLLYNILLGVGSPAIRINMIHQFDITVIGTFTDDLFVEMMIRDNKSIKDAHITNLIELFQRKILAMRHQYIISQESIDILNNFGGKQQQQE